MTRVPSSQPTILRFVWPLAALLPLVLAACLDWSQRSVALLLVAAGCVLFGHARSLRRAAQSTDFIERYPGRTILAPLVLLVVVASAAQDGYSGVLLFAYGWCLWWAAVRVREGLGARGAIASALCLGWFVLPVALSTVHLGRIVDLSYCMGVPIPNAAGLRLAVWLVAGVTVLGTTTSLAVRWGAAPAGGTSRLLAAVGDVAFWWLVTFMAEHLLVSVALWGLFHGLRRRGAPAMVAALVGAGVGAAAALVWAVGVGSIAATRALAYSLEGVLTTAAILHFYYCGFAWPLGAKPARAELRALTLRWLAVMLLAVALASGVQGLLQRELEPAVRYQTVVDAVPAYLEANLRLSTVLALDSQLQAALACAQRAVASWPGNPRAEAQLLLMEGRLSQGDERTDKINRAAALDPGNATGIYWQALIIAADGRRHDAIREFERVLALDPSYLDAHVQIAILSSKPGGSLGVSVAHMQQVAMRRPDDAKVHSFLGWLYYQSGDLEAAITHYSTALELDETDNLSRANAGLLLMELGGTAEAVEQFRWVVEVEPTQVHAQRGLGTALRKLRRFEPALEHYRYARTHHPADAEILFHLGKILASWPTDGIGNAEEAMSVAGDLSLVEPDSPRSLDVMGMALAQSGQTAEAVGYAIRAARLYAVQGEPELAGEVRDRAQLYAARRPYRNPHASESR